MMDFYEIKETKRSKNGVIEIEPDFEVNYDTEYLMIRGGAFYAIWDEETGLWSRNEKDAIKNIDRDLDIYVENNWDRLSKEGYRVLYMKKASSGTIRKFHRLCEDDMRDNGTRLLDEDLAFQNTSITKKDYISKRLPYSLEKGSTEAYDKLMSVLYSDEERRKIEWAIGAIVTGNSKWIQKFLVLYGAPGTGKSTVLNIIQELFAGYCTVFDAKVLGMSNKNFALEAFRNNPLVAIQHDGDLSHIEDNTRLNTIVSHEELQMEVKNKSTYPVILKSFLFMGTNKPVKITDAKSGILRRLIDVTPTGKKLGLKEYREAMHQIGFELGAIAWKCKEVYESDPDYYDSYVPLNMMSASNDFYNFVLDNYETFKEQDGVSLKSAWELYKAYCDETKVNYPLSRMIFKDELTNYFRKFDVRPTLDDGTRPHNYYSGFRTDRFEIKKREIKPEDNDISWITFNQTKSILDVYCGDCPAQYANDKETPTQKWTDVTTKLEDIDTSRLHYVKLPKEHIVIDFDIPDENGEKSLEKNLSEASKWPKTYAELSKSGKGIHLHYIYNGPVENLARLYQEHIEIKVFTGKSSLRRKLTFCNDIQIAEISSGLPLKGEGKKMVDIEHVKTEKGLRTLIKNNLKKKYHAATKPSVMFIYDILEKAYKGGLKYDVSDLQPAVYIFAHNSTHNSEFCRDLVSKMHFSSDEPSENVNSADGPLVFFDVEVYPNLFLVCYKIAGEGNPVIALINPSPTAIEELSRMNLVGFNCRRYDNHVCYARMIGYSIPQIFKLSERIISGEPGCFFGEAWNFSKTDVFDYTTKKQSLKKYEIELNLPHKEMDIPWNQDVPDEYLPNVIEYCKNDVMATEAVHYARQGDFKAREILADITGMTINDTTNSLTTRWIFGDDRKPQHEFNYRDLSKPVNTEFADWVEHFGEDYEFRVFNEKGIPVGSPYHGELLPEGWSFLPFWPDYIFDAGKSYYKGEIIGEGGRVYSNPGMYSDVWDGDIASQHPHSIWAERLFGKKYSRRFYDLVEARVAIKHKDFNKVRTMFDGKLSKYLDDPSTVKDLAYALKIAINSVYGLTSAKFDNPFNDIRNKDNIVAKRGALFMCTLKEQVELLGYKVVHIKTDSIKIENADDYIQDFVCKFGKEYGYSFETEAEFDRFCLVNDAVYIAHNRDWDPNDEKEAWKKGWTATGTQFQIPYVFKTLFAKAPILFDDMCETKSVTSALYLDMNEGLPEGVHDYRFVGKVGRFCPIKPGCEGGELLREAKDSEGNIKYDSATGCKGYRWLESETVETLEKEKDIDISYYTRMVDEAVDTISKYGDFEWFTAVNN